MRVWGRQCLVLVGLSLGLPAQSAEVLNLSRYITIKTCYKGASCIGPTAKNIEHANVKLALERFRKGHSEGEHAWDRHQLREDQVQFKSEIHVIKYAKPGRYKYLVYAMLRSGQREGKIHQLHLKNLADFAPTVISDEPIAFEGGTLQAQLIIGPQLPLDVE